MKVKTVLSQAKSRRGFTLVEMLVVIGMIAALSGISFPVYKSIQKKVEKQQLAMDMGALDRAVDNFFTEYNYLPYIGATYPAVDTKLKGGGQGNVNAFTTVLAGIGGVSNFKNIDFLECREAKGGPGNYYSGLVVTNTTAHYYTAWGSELTRIQLDYDMNGTQTYPYYAGDHSGQPFIYWDMGPDGSFYGFGGTTNDDLTNFDDLRPQ